MSDADFYRDLTIGVLSVAFICLVLGVWLGLFIARWQRLAAMAAKERSRIDFSVRGFTPRPGGLAR